jgi:hypothetical protein
MSTSDLNSYVCVKFISTITGVGGYLTSNQRVSLKIILKLSLVKHSQIAV